VPKKYYPEGITIGYGTLIIPYVSSKKDCRRSALLAGHFSVDRIDKDNKGELQVKISYEPKRDFERDFGESIVTKWYRKGDIVQFFKPINEEKQAKNTLNNRDYLSESLNTDSFGLRIVSIVPRDPYPIRVVGKTKGRLIGWIELDSKVIPLDKDGKPILK
jgi:hypothetical protein